MTIESAQASGSEAAQQTEKAKQLIYHQLEATQNELSQIKSLMDVAIDDLVDSFISLEASVRIEQNLAKLLISGDGGDKQDELNPFRDRQIKTKQLLSNIALKLKALVEDTSDREDGASMQLAKELQKDVSSIIEETANVTDAVAAEIQITTQQIERDVQNAVRALQFQDMTSQLITQAAERQKIILTLQHALCEQGNAGSITQALEAVSRIRMKEFNVNSGSVELFD